MSNQNLNGGKSYVKPHHRHADLETAKQLIRDFCAVEYQVEDVDFSNPEHIGLAYTTTEDDQHEIQVEVQHSQLFFAKALDQVRPGGIVAFVTSRYTMDAKDPTVRKYLAERADLLGAIRLPNNAFKANAGTDVVSDIIFLQKRDYPAIEQPGWVQVGENEDGFKVNSYYLEHPEMVLGTATSKSTQYAGQDYTVAPIDGANLADQLAGAIQNLAAPDRELLDLTPEQEDGQEVESIPADPNVRNYSYALVDGKLYFRENSRMSRVELGKTPTERAKGMMAIRDSARKLIDLQMENAEDAAVKAEQANLNRLYDAFTKKYGLLSSQGNRRAFEQDSSYPLLCSLEIIDENGNLERKADMFTKRTIQNRRAVTHVDTAVEALAVSIGEKARVDLEYMAGLMGGQDKIPQIVEDLKGIIFKHPASGPFDLAGDREGALRGWQAADEYLSGDVRRKLAQARAAAKQNPEFAVNVEKLEQVQPKDLTASEISVRVGASWIDPEYYQQFMFELCQTPWRLQNYRIKLQYSDSTGEWRVLNKSADSKDNVRVHATYGTKRVNAYELFEAALNQRDVRIFLVQSADVAGQPLLVYGANLLQKDKRGLRQPVPGVQVVVGGQLGLDIGLAGDSGDNNGGAVLIVPIAGRGRTGSRPVFHGRWFSLHAGRQTVDKMIVWRPAVSVRHILAQRQKRLAAMGTCLDTARQKRL